MQEQSFERHTHQPVIIGVGYLFLWLALISFALRWFLIGGRVTMALGLILDIVCGRPVAALTPSEVTSPGTDHTKKTGPWIYMPDLTRV